MGPVTVPVEAVKRFSRGGSLNSVGYNDTCEDTMKQSSMFSNCSFSVLQQLCDAMTVRTYPSGHVLCNQNDPQEEMFVIKTGRVQRDLQQKGQTHTMANANRGSVLGAHHVLNRDPVAFSCKCLTPVTALVLNSDSYRNVLKDENVSREVIYSLHREIRRQMTLLQAPLLSQHPKPTPYFAISVAASIESFYRSALNSYLNAKLTGHAPTTLFPDMAVQVPSRVLYVNGFKGIRHVLDEYVVEHDDDHDITAASGNTFSAVRLGVAVAPGIIMTPVSSMLEACNAGHLNAEALSRRWMRGLVPRCFREVIFGVGLNQLSDYCEERLAFIQNPMAKNAVASVMAGVVAGYLSHIPHNLSTLKLMYPEKSYATHVSDLIRRSEARVPTASMSPTVRRVTATLLAFFLPAGLGIRTTQIVGSFIILNGTINSLKDFDLRTHLPVNFFKE